MRFSQKKILLATANRVNDGNYEFAFDQIISSFWIMLWSMKCNSPNIQRYRYQGIQHNAVGEKYEKGDEDSTEKSIRRNDRFPR